MEALNQLYQTNIHQDQEKDYFIISKEFTINDKFNNIITNFSMLLNHYIDLKLIDDLRSFNEILNDHSELLILPKMIMNNEFIIKSNSLLYIITFNQLLYFIVFNQNPFNGSEICSFTYKEYAEKYFNNRLKMMEVLKKEWPEGIPLKYVRSIKLF